MIKEASLEQFMNRDFPLSLKEIGLDTQSKKYFLTVNAILQKMGNGCVDEAIKLRDRILSGIDAGKLLGSGIYNYPKESIHFSIINFKDLSSGLADNQQAFKFERSQHIKKIKEILENETKEIKAKNIDKAIKFGFIYTLNTDSIALQAFPSQDLYDFFKKLADKFNEEPILRTVEIKKNGIEYPRFTVNLARFFRKLTNDEYNKIAPQIYEVNKEFMDEKNFFQQELSKISFVVSDNWLSNNDFLIEDYNLS